MVRKGILVVALVVVMGSAAGCAEGVSGQSQQPDTAKQSKTTESTGKTTPRTTPQSNQKQHSAPYQGKPATHEFKIHVVSRPEGRGIPFTISINDGPKQQGVTPAEYSHRVSGGNGLGSNTKIETKSDPQDGTVVVLLLDSNGRLVDQDDTDKPVAGPNPPKRPGETRIVEILGGYVAGGG